MQIARLSLPAQRTGRASLSQNVEPPMTAHPLILTVSTTSVSSGLSVLKTSNANRLRFVARDDALIDQAAEWTPTAPMDKFVEMALVLNLRSVVNRATVQLASYVVKADVKIALSALKTPTAARVRRV